MTTQLSAETIYVKPQDAYLHHLLYADVNVGKARTCRWNLALGLFSDH